MDYNMVIDLLMNEPEKVYSKLKNVIACENFQDKLNQQILKKLYEELEKGNEYEYFYKRRRKSNY